MLISSQDGEMLSRGIEQRALLLNKVLLDLNTDRQTLTNGVFSTDHLMRHPYYLAESHTLPR